MLPHFQILYMNCILRHIKLFYIIFIKCKKLPNLYSCLKKGVWLLESKSEEETMQITWMIRSYSGQGSVNKIGGTITLNNKY